MVMEMARAAAAATTIAPVVLTGAIDGGSNRRPRTLKA